MIRTLLSYMPLHGVTKYLLILNRAWVTLYILLLPGMEIRQGGDGFYLPRPHTLFSYIYMLSYSYTVGMRNRNPSMSPTDSSIPASSPSPQLNNFFNKNKSNFQPWAQCCNALSSKEMTVVDDYDNKEERNRECEIWMEKRENYNKWVSSERLRL